MADSFKEKVSSNITCATDNVDEALKAKALELRSALNSLLLNSDILDEDKITLEEWKEVFNNLDSDLLNIFNINSESDLKEFIFWRIYIVQSWDRLEDIAKENNTTVQELKTLNNIQNINKIYVWQILKIPWVNSLWSNDCNPTETSRNQLEEDISDLFANMDFEKSVTIKLTSNSPALRDFISPEDYKDFTFVLENAKGEIMEVAYGNWDWRIVENGLATNRRALIWKDWGGDNIIRFVRKKAEIWGTLDAPEILWDGLVRIKCTHLEAIEYERQWKIKDDQWRRIIYFITDTFPFTNPESTELFNLKTWEIKYKKEFVAFHGTGYDENEYWKGSDFEITRSAIHESRNSANFAFLIWRSGCIFQFFDANLGFGALSKRVIENNLPDDMNRNTIAVELALRGDTKWTYVDWVEPPNQNQSLAWKELGDFLSDTYKIDKINFITSYDPVKWIRWAHIDDFSDEARLAMGIPTKQESAMLIDSLKQDNTRFAWN